MNKPKTILTGIALLLVMLAPCSAFAKGVVLNFSDVDISTMVKFISDLTGKNFVMDEAGESIAHGVVFQTAFAILAVVAAILDSDGDEGRQFSIRIF